METVVVRLWLPDRPGALGQVASRIGAVRGEIVGIEILERGAGRAIDELVVDVPDPSLIDLLVDEVRRSTASTWRRSGRWPAGSTIPRLDALETAALLVGAAIVTSSSRGGGARSPSGRRRVVGRRRHRRRRGARGGGPGPELGVARGLRRGQPMSTTVASGVTGPDDVVWSPFPSAQPGARDRAQRHGLPGSRATPDRGPRPHRRHPAPRARPLCVALSPSLGRQHRIRT